ncbi:MAG: HD-GYP domain-containing protein [Methylovulum sp.]|nr:MAG: HD-GYP domain-containing protein [Methylovulum sp.]
MFFKNLWFFRSKKNPKKSDYQRYYSTSERAYTPVGQLAIGMYVVELDRPWLETPFLFQGFEIKNEVQIQSLKNYCNFVYIDRTKTRVIKHSNEVNRPTLPKILSNIDIDKAPPKREGAFEQEILRAESIYANAEYLIANFMQTAAKGEGVDGWQAQKAVTECVSSVLNSPDAMLWLTQLKNKDKYTMQHSLNVCVLAIVFGRYLNLSKVNMVNLGLCGMLHDIGKMQVPLVILNKRGPLDEEELKIMRTHTTLGYELLKSSDCMESCVAETALTHHEHLDGSGYPRGIRQGSISDFTKIVSIVDAYDSMTSDKVYRKGITHLEAIHTLMSRTESYWDKKLIIKFIESLGVYPPGCLVIMTNGAIGIVVEVNEDTKLRPKIILLLDEEKQPVSEQVIDLSKSVCDKKGNVYTIKNIVKAEDWNIDPQKYYSEGLIKKGFAANF